MTHLAFLCAMPMELRPLARRLSLRRARVEGIAVYAGTCGGRPALALATGMGTILAAAATERLLGAAAVSHVQVFGIAGAADNATPVGTIVRPELTVDGASGRQFVPRAAARGGGGLSGILWTTDELITGGDVLADLRARGVVALDMETAAVAHVCEARGVTWSVFRAISDRPSDGIDLEVVAMSNQDGTPNHEAIAAYFERHPEKAALLAETGANAALAAETAAAAAIAALAHV